ncbi:reverse transcriptase domain-containing protein [Tanacetum coccineum]
MTQAAIRQLITDSVTAALEAQAANKTNTDKYNGNTGPTPENKVAFATGTLTDDALSWWNAYAQSIGIEQANRITWTELKKLLTNKYCPRTEIKKMEDEFYGLTIKGSDLKTYIRRFQELTVLCPNMVPNTEKLMEAFIGGLPQSIEGNVTASKPQNLEEAINIAQRLMDQILKHNSVQEANDRKRKFEDRRNTINKNNYVNNNYNGDYPNNLDNSNHSNNHSDNRNHDHHPQQNGRQETFRTYDVSPTKYTRPHIGPCTIKCQNCNRIGHLTRNCGVAADLDEGGGLITHRSINRCIHPTLDGMAGVDVGGAEDVVSDDGVDVVGGEEANLDEEVRVRKVLDKGKRIMIEEDNLKRKRKSRPRGNGIVIEENDNPSLMDERWAEDYLPDYFRKEMYIQAYNQYLTPVDGMSFWPECGESSIILPPKPKTMPGRPRKKRIRARHETNSSYRVSRTGTEMTCQNCGEKGHNKAGCKKEKVVKPPKPPTKKCRPKKTSVEEPHIVDVSDIPAFVNVADVEGSNVLAD